MTTDWNAVERDYVLCGVTYAALADKYGVSHATVAHHGRRMGWVAKRRAHLRAGEETTESEREAANCASTVDRPPDSQANRAPAVDSAALRGKLLALADNWTDQQAGQIEDVGDYRRVVQSVLDLTRAEGDDAAPEIRVVMDVPEGYGE